jgi:hypothetical protein
MRTFPLTRTIVPSLVLLVAGFAAQTADAQAAAPTTCKDGTTSSATGRGACSSHGGVQKAASPGSTASAPAATPAPSAMSKPAAPATTAAKSAASTKSAGGNTDPTGATAKCKDGTYSKSKSHSGACSKHGGVDQFLDGSK